MNLEESTAPNSPEEFNRWQQLSEATGTVVTPANIIDAMGFIGAKYGIDRIDTPRGAAIVALSYGADVIDGKVARATGTESKLGEAVDAAGDKVKLAYGLVQVWRKGLASKPLLTAVAVQNVANSALTLADQRINGKEPVIHSSYLGKRSFFMQELGVGLSIAGTQIRDRGFGFGEKIRKTGNFIGFAGVAVGTVATAGYFNDLKRSMS